MRWQFWVKLALQAAGNIFAQWIGVLLLLGLLWADGSLYWPPDASCLAILGFALFLMFSPFRKKRQKQQTEPAVSKCDIEIQFDRSDRTYVGGDVVSGEVMVRVNQDINCNGIVLRHYWGTHGEGNKRTGTKHELQLCHSHPLQAGEDLRLPFEFQSELWPLTYRGEHINVDHYVHVSVDVPWTIDPKQAEEFVVVAGQRPDQFTGDCSEVVELKAIEKEKEKSGFLHADLSRIFPRPIRTVFGWVWNFAVVCVLFAVMTLLAFEVRFVRFVIVPIAVITGLIYWIRKTARSGRLGEVTIKTPIVVVGPGEHWPCEISFTPKKTFQINEVSARLLVEEVATAGGGKHKTNHRHTLLDEKTIFVPEEQLIAGEPFSKQFQLPLSDTEAWSLDVDDNKIEWTVDVRIDIPQFPDWSHKTTLQMIPSTFLDNSQTPPTDAVGSINSADR